VIYGAALTTYWTCNLTDTIGALSHCGFNLQMRVTHAIQNILSDLSLSPFHPSLCRHSPQSRRVWERECGTGAVFPQRRAPVRAHRRIVRRGWARLALEQMDSLTALVAPLSVEALAACPTRRALGPTAWRSSLKDAHIVHARAVLPGSHVFLATIQFQARLVETCSEARCIAAAAQSGRACA